ncbi:MAG: DegV family protein [Clostridia bacterium]|nr:DegV family protein [Clostridia bacterium]
MSLKIYTDATCDLPLSYIKEHDLTVLPMPISLNGKEYIVGPDENAKGNISVSEFYNRIAAGDRATTAQITLESYTDAFGKELKAGNDIVYLCFSSGLSGCVNAARLATEELLEKYPGREILIVDTLAAAVGEGLVVNIAVEKKEAEPEITARELAAYVESQKLRVHHWFTVGDLKYLAKGGRLSNTSAIVGTVLNIKPILDVSSEGKLVSREKVQGRRKAMRNLADKFIALCDDKQEAHFYVGHTGCEEEAKAVCDMIEQQTGIKPAVFTQITPIIGAHTGIGTIALFFLSDTPRKV